MVLWQSGQESWDAFLKSGAKAWLNTLSTGFVWLLHHGGQAPKFLIPEGDVVQCRNWEPVVFLNIFLLSGLFAMNISFCF